MSSPSISRSRWALLAGIVLVIFLLVPFVFGEDAGSAVDPCLSIGPPKKLPVFSGTVESSLDKNVAARFRYTVKNDTSATMCNVIVLFKENVRPYGPASGHLIYAPAFNGLVWEIKRLPPGVSRTMMIPVAIPQHGGPEICAGATLGVMFLYWGTLYTEPCFHIWK